MTVRSVERSPEDFTFATLASVKSALGITAVTEDAVLQGYLDAACARFENETRQLFSTRTITETQFDVSAVSTVVLSASRVSAVASITADGLTINPTAYDVISTAGFIRMADPVTAGKLVIIYTAGYATAPPDVLAAIVEMVKISRDAGAANSAVRSEQADGVGATTYGTRGELSSSVLMTIARYRQRIVT